MDLALESTAAVVTGAGTGIGRASALRLAEEGARVVLVGRRRELLDEVAAEVVAAGGLRPTVLVADLTDPDAADAVVAQTVAAHGRLDVVVNAAGGADRPGVELTEEVWAAQMDLNFTSRRRLVTAALPWLRASGRGRVITCVGLLEPAVVSAAQAAVAACILWSKALAGQEAPHGVTVNCLAPGRIDSEQVALFHPDEASRRTFAEARIPVGRFGSADEAAVVVAFLAAGAASYVTGETVRVDGGMHRGL